MVVFYSMTLKSVPIRAFFKVICPYSPGHSAEFFNKNI